VVARVGNGVKMVDEGVANARQAGETIGGLQDMAKKVSQLVASVDEALREQASASNDVAKKVEDVAAEIQNPGRIRDDRHPLLDHRGAGRGGQPAAGDFDQADPAGGIGNEAPVIAERRDRNPHRPGGVKDRRARGDVGRPAVDRDLHGRSFFPAGRADGGETRSRQTPAGHLFSRMWISYSSRKWATVERTGLAAV